MTMDLNSASLLAALSAVSSESNTARESAEKMLEEVWLPNNTELLLSLFAESIATSTDDKVRSLAAILFRRLAFKINSIKNMDATFWSRIPPAAQANIKNLLFQAFLSEKLETVRNKIADSIAEIVRSILCREENWQEVWTALLQLASVSAVHRAGVFRIVSSVPELLSQQSTVTVKDFFAQGLTQDGSLECQSLCLTAFSVFLDSAKKSERKALAPLFPFAFQALTQSVNSIQHLQDSLTAFTELLVACHASMKDLFPSIASFCTSILQAPSIDDDSVKILAMEMFVTMIEMSPMSFKKDLTIATLLINTLVALVAHIEENEDWAEEDENEDNEDEEMHSFALSAIDRVANSLSGKVVVNLLYPHITNMARSQKWNERFAALMMIAVSTEGCSVELLKNLPHVIEMILSLVNDNHPRVQYAIAHALAMLSTDFAPTVQQKYHSGVMSALASLLQRNTCIRVKAHAAAAVINFADGCEDTQVMKAYLDVLFTPILSLLSSDKMYALEQGVSTIATIANSSSDGFIKYGAEILPKLMSVIKQGPETEHKALLCKSVDAISLIAAAIGKQGFSPFMNEYLTALLQFQALPLEDEIHAYLPSVWIRMCELLQGEFAALLPNVMPSLIKLASVEPDMALLDGDQEPDDDMQDGGWEFLSVQGKKVAIKTSTLDDKASAVDTLGCFVQILGPAMASYTNELFELFVPLLTFMFHDGVRAAAANGLAPLLATFVKAGAAPTLVLEKFTVAYNAIFKSIAKMYNPDYIPAAIDALNDCLKELGTNYAAVPEFINAVTVSFSALFNEIANRLKEEAEDADVADDIDDYENDNVNVLSEAISFFSQMFVLLKDRFLPVFEKFVPFFSAGLSSNLADVRHLCACAFDDLVQYSGPSSFRLHKSFVAQFMPLLKDESAPFVRQAASFGVGLWAQYGGSDYYQYCFNSLPVLLQQISAQNAQEEENAIATDNAVSAIAKIMSVSRDNFVNSPHLAQWVAVMPIVSDKEEIPFALDFFLSLIDGTNLKNDTGIASHMIYVLASYLSPKESDEVLLTDAALKDKVIKAFNYLSKSVDANAAANAWKRLTADQQTSLKAYIQ